MNPILYLVGGYIMIWNVLSVNDKINLYPVMRARSYWFKFTTVFLITIIHLVGLRYYICFGISSMIVVLYHKITMRKNYIEYGIAFTLLIESLLLVGNILSVLELHFTPQHIYIDFGYAIGIILILATIYLIQKKTNNMRIILPGYILNVFSFAFLMLCVVSRNLMKAAGVVGTFTYLVFVVLIMSLYIILGVMNSYYGVMRCELEKKLRFEKYESQSKYLREQDDELAKLWHDINSYLNVLDSIKDSDKSTLYLHELSNRIHSITDKNVCTGNELADCIIREKIMEAEAVGITMKVIGAVPNAIPIDQLDLTSLLCNCIENAIEAAAGMHDNNSTLEIELAYQKNFLYFRIYNSVSEIKKNEKIYYKNYIGSGYGNLIIEEIVNKYDGDMKITADEDSYERSIILHV